MSTTVVVSEVFGPTIQGEGPHTGQRVAFIRLGGCNLTCRWCDTAYTWDARRFDLKEELTRQDIGSVIDQVVDMDVGRVVISGGEPLLQDRSGYGLRPMVFDLYQKGIRVDVETNGTVTPSTALAACVDLFVVSPKLTHAGMPEDVTVVGDTLRWFAAKTDTVLKVVCSTPSDVIRAAELAGRHGFPKRRTWVMPLGSTREELSGREQLIADEALVVGINFSPRLHIALWGSERGR